MQLPVARWSSQRVAAWAAALSLPEPQGVNMDKDDGDEEEQVQEAVMGVLQLPPGMKGRELIRCSVVRLGNYCNGNKVLQVGSKADFTTHFLKNTTFSALPCRSLLSMHFLRFAMRSQKLMRQ